jgi:alpha-L-fucosidase 2
MDTSSKTMPGNWLLWYKQPADHWADGLPLANGRMGAMVYGGVRVERCYLSETTFWSGEPSLENNNVQGPDLFQTVRKELLSRDVAAANQLAQELEGRKLNYGTNLPFGNLRLLFNHEELSECNYGRELDLDTAIVRVRYRIDQTDYQREMFISAPYRVMVIRLTCSRPAGLTFRAALDSDEQPCTVHSEGTDTLLMDNRAWETLHSNGQVGVVGHARLCVRTEGGQVTAIGNQLSVTLANSATIFLAVGTSFAGHDPATECHEYVQVASGVPYGLLLSEHGTEHQSWFRRANLDLGSSPHPDWSLDQRIEAARQGENDPHLCALLFQFGRYLLIGSSRPDSPLPAHLTGAWNDNHACRIGWTCDYHLDINTQMNYWIAELTNLSECHQPLFRWIEQTLLLSGRKTAHTLYGLPGWVAHIFSNAWGFTAWGWSTEWGAFPTGGVWVATHFWDHYCFTGDRQFLTEHAYPVLKEAAEFCLAYLIKDPQTGWLVSGPANSPENAFRYQDQTYTVALGPTVDRVLIDELFSICIEASQILEIDEDFRTKLNIARGQLPPYQIGKHGQIQEWLEDYEEAIPGHRHTSHLLGLFPFAQITPFATPELAQAARISVDRRVAASDYEEGAWARNNITLFYARLQDSEAAYNSLTTLFRKEAGNSFLLGTRLAPLDAYELDYNTGASAGIAEMLLQSHSGCIIFLPALPDAWPEGQVQGLRARGGFEVAIQWKNHQLVESRVQSTIGGGCRVRLNMQVEVICEGVKIPTKDLFLHGIEFATQAGKEYLISNLSVHL